MFAKIVRRRKKSVIDEKVWENPIEKRHFNAGKTKLIKIH